MTLTRTKLTFLHKNNTSKNDDVANNVGDDRCNWDGIVFSDVNNVHIWRGYTIIRAINKQQSVMKQVNKKKDEKKPS